eukprot:508495_1
MAENPLNHPKGLSPEQYNLMDQFIEFALTSSDSKGVNDAVIKKGMGERAFEALGPIFNLLLFENRMVLKQGTDGSLWYKVLEKQEAVKFKDLGPEQMMVYQVIEKAGDKGIWTRDIKNQTNIQQQSLNKALKILEQRNLIKTVKSVTSRSKKLYILADIEPNKDITGGPWYTDQEFDHAFIEVLSSVVVEIVERAQYSQQPNQLFCGATLEHISKKIEERGICNVPLLIEEVELVVKCLVYDHKLEERKIRDETYYALEPNNSYPINALTQVPCGVCKISQKCSENGVISPATCKYMDEWLKKPDQMDDDIEEGVTDLRGGKFMTPHHLYQNACLKQQFIFMHTILGFPVPSIREPLGGGKSR